MPDPLPFPLPSRAPLAIPRGPSYSCLSAICFLYSMILILDQTLRPVTISCVASGTQKASGIPGPCELRCLCLLLSLSLVFFPQPRFSTGPCRLPLLPITAKFELHHVISTSRWKAEGSHDLASSITQTLGTPFLLTKYPSKAVTAPSKPLQISHLPGHISLYLMMLVHIEGSSWFWAGCCHESFATNMA